MEENNANAHKVRGAMIWLNARRSRPKSVYKNCRSFRRSGKRSGNRRQRVQDRRDRHALRGIVRSGLAHSQVLGREDVPRTTSGKRGQQPRRSRCWLGFKHQFH